MNRTNLIAGHLNLISRDMIPCPERFLVEIGAQQPPKWATITQVSSSRVFVKFDAPQTSVQRGATISIYDGQNKIGNCVIE